MRGGETMDYNDILVAYGEDNDLPTVRWH